MREPDRTKGTRRSLVGALVHILLLFCVYGLVQRLYKNTVLFHSRGFCRASVINNDCAYRLHLLYYPDMSLLLFRKHGMPYHSTISELKPSIPSYR